MKIAICSDERHAVHDIIVDDLRARGHEVVPFGSIETGQECPWPETAEQAARSISDGDCEEGIFLCWTGTGISMAANKIPGIRAALCFDAPTAAGARTWNHANVLCLSNRMLSSGLAREILEAWFGTKLGESGRAGVASLNDIDQRYRKR